MQKVFALIFAALILLGCTGCTDEFLGTGAGVSEPSSALAVSSESEPDPGLSSVDGSFDNSSESGADVSSQTESAAESGFSSVATSCVSTSSSAVASGSSSTGSSSQYSTSAKASSKSASLGTSSVAVKGEFRAVWISFLELKFTGKTQAQFQAEINQMFDNVRNMNMNAVIVHVRPFSDAYYDSAYFPWTKQMTGTQGKNPGYDPLLYMITAAHARGLQLHAWINPLRVLKDAKDYSTLSSDNPAKVWREDKDTSNDDWVVNAANGIFYNPAYSQVRKLIIDGVREIVKNYQVDGIHFDDYFYPTTSATFDQKAYDAYLKATASNPMTLAQWRRNNINMLVSGVYSVTRQYKAPFGISPAANIDHNINDLGADVKTWLSSSAYVDYICPQIYFGFEYPVARYRYDTYVQQWSKLITNSKIDLYIGLAPYKIGTVDPDGSTASGAREWIEKTDLLKREVEYARTISNYKGFVAFSYSYLFKNSDLFNQQRENLRKILGD